MDDGKVNIWLLCYSSWNFFGGELVDGRPLEGAGVVVGGGVYVCVVIQKGDFHDELWFDRYI